MLKIKNKLQPNELKAAYALLKKSYWSAAISEDTFNTQNKHTLSYGIFLDDKLIGFFRLVTDGVFVCYLMDLIIEKEMRGTKIGSFVLNFIKETYGNLKIILRSTESQAFYLKNGFKEISKEDNYFIFS